MRRGEVASDAVGGQARFKAVGILGLAGEVVDDATAAVAAAEAMHRRQRFLRGLVASMPTGGLRQRSQTPQS